MAVRIKTSLLFSWRLVIPFAIALSITGCSFFGAEPSTTEGLPGVAPAVAPTTAAQEEPSFLSSLFFWNNDTKSAEPAAVAPAVVPVQTPKPLPITPPAPAKKKNLEPEQDWNFVEWAFSLFKPDLNLLEIEDQEPGSSKSEETARKKKVQQFIQAKLLSINTLYVQSFTGENLDEVRVGLYNAIRAQGRLKLREILPDDTKGMAVLRIHVDDFAIWDQEENFEQLDLDRYDKSAKTLVPAKIIRRNALVGVQLSLFDAESGLPLVRGRYSQPFQQIYAGKAIQDMPRSSVEMERLTQILITKILKAFNSSSSNQFVNLDLERGTSWGWFAQNIHDLGDSRIAKGIKMAKSGHLDEAVSLWKLVLFSQKLDEPEAIYRVNRASSFYNLGVVYQMQGDHLFAAKMFSQANRLKQTLRYAQAWGDNMHAWINEENKQVRQFSPDIEAFGSKKDKVKPKKIKPDVVLLLETNPSLLLKAQQLWPLEPVIKNATAEELNGTQRTKLDRPPTRFDRKGYIDYGSDGQDSYPLPRRITAPKPKNQGATDPINQGFIQPSE